MKKRIVFLVIFVIIFGVIGALMFSPEFCNLWKETPVLKDIYAWAGKYLESFASALTKGEKRFLYISIIGSILISLFVFGFLGVRKVKSGEEKTIEVSATPVINSNGPATIVVVEEN